MTGAPTLVRKARLDHVAANRPGRALRSPLFDFPAGPPPQRPEAMEPAADPGLVLNVYTVEPASPSADALDLLASWAATVASAESAPAADRT